MTLLLTEKAGPATAALEIRPEDIGFSSLGPDRVQIEITVRNAGCATSDQTPVHLQSAPLGAFLPWQPLTTLIAPPLAPGSDVTLRAEVQRQAARPLGDFEGLPPEALLTAVGGEKPTRPSDVGRKMRTYARRRQVPESGRDQGRLAPDIFELIGRPGAHWAGNINVYTGARAVERHLAKALRIYPGRTNYAQFFVGRMSDAYAFELEGHPLAEHAFLIEPARGSSLIHGTPRDETLRLGEWIEARRTMLVLLVIEVPRACTTGNLKVHVQQRSTGERATIEFGFDANAAGRGCYVV